jgi:hypothetical protein
MIFTVYGVLALSFMMLMNLFEKWGPLVLAFAIGCAQSSSYGFLSGAWPFRAVEAVWTLIAVGVGHSSGRVQVAPVTLAGAMAVDRRWENQEVTMVPIACTLTADAAVGRVAEWRSFLGSKIRSVDRAGNVATLTLVGGSETLVMAADLAEREKTCCAFFAFSIEFDGSDVRLRVEVPPDAEPVLTGLLGLVPS